jgi:hypothetical protein
MSGLPSLDFLNRTPSLLGDSSSSMTLLSLLSQNLTITNIATIGKIGDARSSDQLVTNGEVMNVWVPTFIRNPPAIANGLTIGGTVDITGDLTIRGKLIVDSVGVSTPGAGSLTITELFEGTNSAVTNLSRGDTTVSGNLTVSDSTGFNWITGTFPDGQCTINATLRCNGDEPAISGVFVDPVTLDLFSTSTDLSGTFTILTSGGNGIFDGDVVQIFFSNNYSTAPVVILVGANANTGAPYGLNGNDSFYVETFINGFQVTFTDNSLVSDQLAQYDYFVIDTSNTVPP